jgi:squalene cyclase
MNPSEVFGDIMIDYSYVECSSACMTALKQFSNFYPDYRTSEVLNAIQAGRAFLKSIQVTIRSLKVSYYTIIMNTH